MHGIDKVGSRS